MFYSTCGRGAFFFSSRKKLEKHFPFFLLKEVAGALFYFPKSVEFFSLRRKGKRMCLRLSEKGDTNNFSRASIKKDYNNLLFLKLFFSFLIKYIIDFPHQPARITANLWLLHLWENKKNTGHRPLGTLKQSKKGFVAWLMSFSPSINFPVQNKTLNDSIMYVKYIFYGN